MFSRLNHHHLGQRSASVPPLAGVRRRRGPDSTPSEASEEGDDDSQLKKSPHTRRVVKRGRRTEPPATPGTPQFLPQPTPPAAPFSLDPDGPLARPTPAKHVPRQRSMPTDGALDDMLHLERLLDSALATAVIIQASSPQASLLTAHSRSVLNAIKAITSLDEPITEAPKHQNVPTAPPKKSYAQATNLWAAPSAPKRTRPQVPPAGPRNCKTKPTAPIKNHRSPQKLILRWYKPLSVSPAQLLEFVQSTRASGLGDRKKDPIAAANISTAGCVVIHACPPFTARDLVPFVDGYVAELADIAGLDMEDLGEPYVDLDVPWDGMVIHDVPSALIRTSRENEEFSSVVQEALGLGESNYKGYQLLVRSEVWEAEEREMVSVHVKFEESPGIEMLLTRGVFILGKRCRVSRYQPRKRHRPSLMQDPPRTNLDQDS